MRWLAQSPPTSELPVMSKAYICSVSSRFPENYEIGVLAGKWGVEAKYRGRLAPVQRGDLLIFVVAGCFRSIHRVTSPPHEEHTLLWPPKDGDLFPHRIDIGPAEATGSARVSQLAPNISFMRGRVWGGTLQGPNGVFNSRATPDDVALIRLSLLAQETDKEATPEELDAEQTRVLSVASDCWWPGLLDQLAQLAQLQRTNRYPDPFEGADAWRRGMLTGMYTDRRDTPTVAVAPIDRSPPDTVLSTLFGLSAVKQTATHVREVRGVIFTSGRRDDIGELVRGVSNLSAIPFAVQISLLS